MKCNFETNIANNVTSLNISFKDSYRITPQNLNWNLKWKWFSKTKTRYEKATINAPPCVAYFSWHYNPPFLQTSWLSPSAQLNWYWVIPRNPSKPYSTLRIRLRGKNRESRGLLVYDSILIEFFFGWTAYTYCIQFAKKDRFDF